MKLLVKTKLLENKYVEVRSYELNQDLLKIIHCLSADYKNCGHFNDPFMFLSLAQQKNGKFVNTQQSKFPPYSYYGIYKFLWKPFKENMDQTISMDQALMRLAASEEWEKLRIKLHES